MTNPRIGKIPIANIWLLFLYAHELARHWQDDTFLGAERDDQDLPELVAQILCHSVERRLRRPLNRTYQPASAVLTRVRGRIDVTDTYFHDRLRRGTVSCRFEAPQLDLPRYRLVNAVLRHLVARLSNADLAHRCRALSLQLTAAGVGAMRPSRAVLATDVIGRNDANDRLMTAAAELVFDMDLPTEADRGKGRLMAERTEQLIRKLFEKAVAGFCAVELPRSDGWEVQASKQLQWPLEETSTGLRQILQGMEADIVVTNHREGRRLVIDTKFTEILAEGRQGRPVLKADYVRQIYAYLRSQSGRGDHLADSARGLMLHPAAGQDLDEWMTVQGHRIRFATVDLMAPKEAIRGRLRELVSWG